MSIRVLLVEDSDSDARLAEIAMKETERDEFMVTRVTTLYDAVETYKKDSTVFDVVLLDLGLPDCQGIDTLSRWFTETDGNIPVVILSGLHDQLIVLNAMRIGAQDYLAKDELISGILSRSLQYAVERHTTAEKRAKTGQQELDLARTRLGEIVESLHKITSKTYS